MSSLNIKVKYRLVKLQALSGKEASVYTVLLDNEQITLFDRFLLENKDEYQEELKSILERLISIANKVGAREQFFKQKEGSPGDLVCALFDEPEKLLRLYCVRFGKSCILLGGGGPKRVRALQEDKKLTLENKWIRQVSLDIYNRMLNREIKWSEDGFQLIGNLNFNQEDEE